jgi:hypothetical protein
MMVVTITSNSDSTMIPNATIISQLMMIDYASCACFDPRRYSLPPILVHGGGYATIVQNRVPMDGLYMSSSRGDMAMPSPIVIGIRCRIGSTCLVILASVIF